MASSAQAPASDQSRATTQRPPAAIAAARRHRDDAAALRAESRQANHQARALVRQGANAILDSAAAIAESVLAGHRIALAEPVSARFRAHVHGSHGIELTVRLKDPARSAAAKRALIERFGGEARGDAVIVT
jgi:hypothetical protein